MIVEINLFFRQSTLPQERLKFTPFDSKNPNSFGLKSNDNELKLNEFDQSITKRQEKSITIPFAFNYTPSPASKVTTKFSKLKFTNDRSHLPSKKTRIRTETFNVKYCGKNIAHSFLMTGTYSHKPFYSLQEVLENTKRGEGVMNASIKFKQKANYKINENIQ